MVKQPKRKRKATKRTVKGYQIPNATPELVVASQQVAATFRAAMKAAGIDDTTLARKLEVTESRVYQLLNGRAITLRSIVAVFAACKREFKITAE